MNFNFGAPKTTGGFALPTATTPASTPAVNFNTSGGSLTLGQAAKPPTFGLGFGTPAASTTGFTLGTATTTATVSFGAGAPATQSTAPTPSSTGFALGTPASSAATTTSALPSFGLGAFSQQSAAATLPSATPATGAPTVTFNLPTTSATSGAAATTPAFAVGKAATAASSAAALPLTSTSSATSISLSGTSSTVSLTGTLTFLQLEEALNKWNLDLEDQSKLFLNQATQLNAWDRLVITNGDKILTLNKGIEKVKQQQQRLDHELDFILAQQRELEDCIVPLEKELNNVPVADLDRNQTYQMAENLDTQLKQMSEDLKEIIEHLNASNKTEDSSDPVSSIGRILNAHMNSLQWVDRNTAQISSYLDQITKLHDLHRRDNERSFHLTYE